MKIKLSRSLLLFLLVLSFAACKHISNEHLPPKTMKKILLDMNIAEGYSSIARDSLHRPGMKNFDSLAVWYKEIFAHYNITSAQFTESLNWYKGHPAEMDSMYADMLITVTKWQDAKRKPR